MLFFFFFFNLHLNLFTFILHKCFHCSNLPTEDQKTPPKTCESLFFFFSYHHCLKYRHQDDIIKPKSLFIASTHYQSTDMLFAQLNKKKKRKKKGSITPGFTLASEKSLMSFVVGCGRGLSNFFQLLEPIYLQSRGVFI